MRQGPLESTAALFGDVRAGRAAARSDVSGLKQSGQAAENSDASLRCPGLTASFPAAQEPRSGEVTRRFVVPQEEKTATPAEPAWPLGGIASDASAAQGAAKRRGNPSLLFTYSESV